MHSSDLSGARRRSVAGGSDGQPSALLTGHATAGPGVTVPARRAVRAEALLAAGLGLVACTAGTAGTAGTGGTGSAGGTGGALESGVPSPAGSAPGTGSATALSGSDRATTAGVCVNVSGQVATAVGVAVKLATQSEPASQAQAQLQPILASLTTIAQQNPGLPISSTLLHLADAIGTVQKANATDLPGLRSAATDIGSAGRDVAAACAAAAR